MRRLVRCVAVALTVGAIACTEAPAPLAPARAMSLNASSNAATKELIPGEYIVVLKPGATASPSELRDFLAPQFAKFWLPDAFEFVDAIPRTSAGKFKKSALRERFKDYRLTEEVKT